MRALEKYSSKRRLITKLAEVAATLSALGNKYSTSPVKVTASHSSNPMTPLSRVAKPTGIRGIMAKGQGAVDNLQRFSINRSLAGTGLTWRNVMPKNSMTNMNLKAGPLSVGTTLTGGSPTSLNLGWSGNLSKNIRGNIGARLPVGANRNQRNPYFTGNIQGTF